MQRDSEISSKIVYQAILNLVYAGKTIFVKSVNAPEWTPTDDNHKSGAQWSPDLRELETRLSVLVSIIPCITPPPKAPLGYHSQGGLGTPLSAFPPLSPDAALITRCWLDRLNPWECQNYCLYLLHGCIVDTSCNNFWHSSVSICYLRQEGYGRILRHDHHRRMWTLRTGPGIGPSLEWLNVSDGGPGKGICTHKLMVFI